MRECELCNQRFMPEPIERDSPICPDCIAEAYRHKPETFAQIKLTDGGSYVVPLAEVGTAIQNEISGDLEAGAVLTITLIELSQAEYEALPEFAGH